ncbi:type II toxin-antitoxin system HicA family toxin [Acidipropionibacterium acidipropionici]|uniref:type II toxin-antitoxin system HicA family toxin n=1 Tax=Acidipropionibacterium acidipropionici TaxID=1748 RepID=UPI00110AD5C1|nr:type II toxin-antitoxin system HicA family toxin [Acidipropionibacterium acidipropionici]QCV95981.1 type II toxin-antitoxin system HicA family toxin [Acidipropionibacterium acidipropionici]
MPKPQKYRDVVRFLRAQGWVLFRQAKGSHEIWSDPATGSKLSIPNHREVSAGIVAQIIREIPGTPKSWRS